jgi:hypothetical protein
MGRLSLSRAWEESAAILVREGGLLAAVALALIVLPQLLLAVVGIPMGNDASFLGRLVYIAAALLGFVAQIAVNRLAIGPPVTVRDAIAQGFVRVAPVFAVLILLIVGLVLITIVVVVILGAAGLMALPSAGQAPSPALLLVLVIATALLFAIFQLIFPLAAVETGNPLRLIVRSWQLGRSQYLRLLAFLIVVFLGIALLAFAGQYGAGSVVVLLFGQPNPGSFSALILGLILGLIQALFTVTTAVMLARIYVQLAGRDAHASVPSSGT